VPGFPAKWDHASIRHPDFNFEFRREDVSETYVIEPKFSKPMKLKLQIPAMRNEVASVTVNGIPAKWNWLTNSPGESRVEILADSAARSEVVVAWKGDVFSLTPALSRWEREKRPQSPGITDAASSPDNSQPAERSQLLFPLPGGEGQGEGKAFDWNKKLPASVKLEAIPLTAVFNDQVAQIFRNDYRSPRSPFCSLATPKHGIGGWCEPDASFDVDDSGLRSLAAKNGGKIILPDGISFATPGENGAKNIIFTSQWDNYPREVSVPLAGKSSRAFLLMAGSTGAMQSQFDNGEIVVAYADGSVEKLPLRNPTNWWPIDQDYFMDDFAFRRDGPVPPRVDLRTGRIRILDAETFKGTGGKVPGGAATVLDLPLDKNKELKSLTVRALANEVVIGLMSVTLAR